MGKSNRSINPADALRKKQRRRELQKNKDERKRARETVLAKKDVGRVKSEISKLENMASSGQLAKPDQIRLDSLKAEASKIERAKKNSSNQLTGAQAAYAARMQEHEKKHEGEARKMVYDPKSGKFVAAKKKDVKPSKKAVVDQEEDESAESDSDSDSDSSSSVSSDESIEGIETEEEVAVVGGEERVEKKEITESDDDYEIPLPPGPPPPKPFASQVPIAQNFGGRRPPPPPPLPYHTMPQYQHPPPQPYAYSQYQAPPRPSVHYEAQPTRPAVHYEAQPVRPAVHYEASATRPTVHHEASASNEAKKPVVATISAEPQLRDLQKELLGFVPASVRRKQIKKDN
ncbi:hypothetical protein G6F56_006807 [Rhizopus delemar]|uniref:Wbp11/ELF5/Saf1 N-terminal domain-containing protein n=1 Tax=Rhizopus stolonifer TaxID=4846 RepID=A0A367JHU3_RHIST|nr:hypothetical protein G6F56_006807 [Rhizopus delemar]RCH89532.1 hypothetical protein CU098_007111 [Rhizopus stolonifer]